MVSGSDGGPCPRSADAIEYDAEVVEYFDALARSGPSHEEMVRRVAQWCGARVGIRTHGSAEGVIADPEGRVGRGAPTDTALTATTGDDRGIVWIDRGPGGAPSPRDGLIVDRLRATALLVRRMLSDDEPPLSRDVAVETVLSSMAYPADRARALRMLGFDGGSLYVVAVTGPEGVVDGLLPILQGRGGRTHSHSFDSVAVVLTENPPPRRLDVPVGARVVVSAEIPGLSAPQTWHRTCVALQFLTPSSRATGPYQRGEAFGYRTEESSVVELMSVIAQHVPRRALAELDSLRALDRIVDQPGGDELLQILSVVAGTDSLRQAAALIHMHHGSVRRRVDWAEEELGFRVTEPYGRTLLMLLLLLHRLRDSVRFPGGFSGLGSL